MSNPVKDRPLASKSEAARHFGVSAALITRKFKQGKLVMVGDKVDLEASAHVFTRQAEAAPSASTPTASVIPPAAGTETFSDAQRRKESALANLRELEHRQKIYELVSVDEQAKVWAGVAQTVRDGFLALPELLAPELAALTDPRQVRDRLDSELRAVLANLPERINVVLKEAP